MEPKNTDNAFVVGDSQVSTIGRQGNNEKTLGKKPFLEFAGRLGTPEDQGTSSFSDSGILLCGTNATARAYPAGGVQTV
jgi:hypothetical protein